MELVTQDRQQLERGAAVVATRTPAFCATIVSAMSTLEEILTTLREQHAILSRRYPIQRLALFGSWARGDAREDSDVDILVEVDPSIGLRFVDLGDQLEEALGRRVDLVSRRAIKPSYWKRIEAELIDA
jgi:predicted nucleotidyltransferase